ncbi:hypothetical protein EV426DRAFT_712585 [Tirmania nivea]|nr:hypothetical protein EV426DRAFT_712585 [Tirmania nivea]
MDTKSNSTCSSQVKENQTDPQPPQKLQELSTKPDVKKETISKKKIDASSAGNKGKPKKGVTSSGDTGKPKKDVTSSGDTGKPEKDASTSNKSKLKKDTSSSSSSDNKAKSKDTKLTPKKAEQVEKLTAPVIKGEDKGKETTLGNKEKTKAKGTAAGDKDRAKKEGGSGKEAKTVLKATSPPAPPAPPVGLEGTAVVVHGIPTYRLISNLLIKLVLLPEGTEITALRWLLPLAKRAGKKASSLVVYLNTEQVPEDLEIRLGKNKMRITLYQHDRAKEERNSGEEEGNSGEEEGNSGEEEGDSGKTIPAASEISGVAATKTAAPATTTPAAAKKMPAAGNSTGHVDNNHRDSSEERRLGGAGSEGPPQGPALTPDSLKKK